MKALGMFILRPVGTTLLCLAMVLAGLLAYRQLPVAPLPQVDFPMISVSASMPGASAETMASSVAMPLEQSLGAIAGLVEMSSRSSEGSTSITLRFDLGRDVNNAARDVQAAINAARPMLPSGLRGNPAYHKINPSSAPIMTLALSSATATKGELYDIASTILAQKLSQVAGVGEVSVGGSSLPAVRVSLNPHALAAAGVALDDVRNALSGANSMRPTGIVENDQMQWLINSRGQLEDAAQYRDLVVAWKDGSPLRLGDVATVENSVESRFNAGFFNDRSAVVLMVRRQPDANIISTVEAIRAQLPQLQALLPAEISLDVAMDRTPSIRASLHEAEFTLVLAVLLVVVVVLAFLGNLRAAVIPSVAVPVSLIVTFTIMWWFGFSLNTLSLMALIAATGFVVDDAIVVLESIMRHMEKGLTPLRAAMRGLREVGFTVVAMSFSLVAVFLPMLLMGDMLGRMFREFAVTLSAAVLVSMVVSLMLTPMMCARLLPAARDRKPPNHVSRLFMRFGAWVHRGYANSLDWSLTHGRFMLLILAMTIGLNGYLYVIVPKSMLPQQDTGQLLGFFRVDDGTSFQAMEPKLDHFRQIIMQDPAVESVAGFAGGRSNSFTMLIVQLKPVAERGVSANDVVNRLRDKLQGVPGARLFLVPQQDIFMGGPQGSASYSYTLLGSDLDLIKAWLPRVQQALASLPELVDVDTDIEDKAQRVQLHIDRDAVTRLGIDMNLIASTLNSAFSDRQVSVIYQPLNQYRVVMSVDPRYAQNLAALRQLQVIASDGRRVPLSAFTRFEMQSAPNSVRHQGLFAAENISFSLAPGVTLAQAVNAVEQAVAAIKLPTQEIQAGFLGEAEEMQRAVGQQPLLVLAALITMYIVLGVLYESYLHPLTILSTLPSAGIGALLALMLTNEPFSLVALIGVFLLIGIVKKNAIMMVDFALTAQRAQGLSSRDAIVQACLVRFRPIMMTTASTIFGALPLILSSGAGAEMRQPLGIAIIGGLIVSQVLTLYTTPVVYLTLDRWRQRRQQRSRRGVDNGDRGGKSTV